MKKIVALLLALVLCLGLCACGAKSEQEGSEYVGTYVNDRVIIGSYYGNYFDDAGYEAVAKLQLDSNMTGSYVVTYNEDVEVLNNMTFDEVVFRAKKGDVYASYDLTWEVDEDCIIVYYEGIVHPTLGEDKTNSGSWVSELKGNELMGVQAGLDNAFGSTWYYIKEK